ncbi:MAG: hypothetical protein ACRC4M_02910 [Mycoplasma sp.]
MSQNIIKFLEAVISRKFATKHQGYDPSQVDETLDSIVSHVNELLDDWNEMVDKYSKLDEKYKTIITQLESVTREKSILEGKITQFESSGVSSAIINERLNKLESTLYESPEDLKNKTKK